MSTPAPDSLVLMGKITQPHGLGGEVRVIPFTDEPSRLIDLGYVYLGEGPEQVQRYTCTTGRIQEGKRKDHVVLLLEGVEDRTAAEALKKNLVYADEADLPLAEDEVFLHDLIGLPVETVEGEAVGTLKDVLQLPAHDLYVVARPGRPDALIPVVPAFVEAADPELGCIRIRPIEGLLD